MKPGHLWIRDVMVIPMDDACSVLGQASIVVSDGVITAIGPGIVPKNPEQYRSIDGAGYVVVPGLINAHTHSPAALGRGSGDRDDHPRFMWRNQGDTWGRTPEEIYDCTRFAALEMLRSGTTAVIDHYPEQPFDLDAVEPVVEAYRDAGLRACIALRVFDEDYYDILPSANTVLPPDLQTRMRTHPLLPKTAEEQIRICREAIERWHGGGGSLLQIMVAPSSPLRCSDGFLRALGDLAKAYDTGIHTHLLETPAQVAIARERYGKGLVERLEDLDLLGPRLSCAHGIYVDDSDIQRLAASGTTVVHNPVSNLRIGDGIAPVVRMLRAGVPLALGTDGVTTNDNLNLFEELKLAAILHRVSGDPMEHWISDREALAMATRGGAYALQAPQSLGRIAPGHAADLLLFDLDSIPFTPLNDPIRQLVFASGGSGLHTVIVAGRILVEGGRTTQGDEAEILRRARHAWDGVRLRNQDIYRLADDLAPFLRQTSHG